jgi:hypothetical protein
MRRSLCLFVFSSNVGESSNFDCFLAYAAVHTSKKTTLGKDLGGPSWNEKGDTFLSDENEEGASDGTSQEDSEREQRKLELEVDYPPCHNLLLV